MKTEDYIVRLIRPRGVSKAEMCAYIENAVARWKGQFDAYDDPLFELDSSSVKCMSARTRNNTQKEIKNDN